MFLNFINFSLGLGGAPVPVTPSPCPRGSYIENLAVGGSKREDGEDEEAQARRHGREGNEGEKEKRKGKRWGETVFPCDGKFKNLSTRVEPPKETLLLAPRARARARVATTS